MRIPSIHTNTRPEPRDAAGKDTAGAEGLSGRFCDCLNLLLSACEEERVSDAAAGDAAALCGIGVQVPVPGFEPADQGLTESAEDACAAGILASNPAGTDRAAAESWEAAGTDRADGGHDVPGSHKGSVAVTAFAAGQDVPGMQAPLQAVLGDAALDEVPVRTDVSPAGAGSGAAKPAPKAALAGAGDAEKFPAGDVAIMETGDTIQPKALNLVQTKAEALAEAPEKGGMILSTPGAARLEQAAGQPEDAQIFEDTSQKSDRQAAKNPAPPGAQHPGLHFAGVYSGRESAIGTVQSGHMVSQVVRSVADMARGEKRELTLELAPAELGKIKIKLEIAGGRLHLKMIAERDQTADTLIGRLAELKASLEAMQIDVRHIDIGRDGAFAGFALSDQPGFTRQNFKSGEGTPDRYHGDGADEEPTRPDAGTARYRSSRLVDFIA